MRALGERGRAELRAGVCCRPSRECRLEGLQICCGDNRNYEDYGNRRLRLVNGNRNFRISEVEFRRDRDLVSGVGLRKVLAVLCNRGQRGDANKQPDDRQAQT